ncbi:MAG TPA: DUF2231 domain-containing protein [Chthonomonadaceae bacterium]|nr:DUF2231 domain-containing protein [Chthonomonadaceae bacterium]
MRSRLILALSLLLCALSLTTVQAKPEYLDVLVQTYKPYSKALEDRSCANCHVSNSDFTRNPYGKQVAIAMEQAGTKDLTPAVLQSIENTDIFGDGSAVIAKIKAGAAPGAPTPGAKVKSGGTNGTAVSEQKKPWFPSYAYHPAIVHFPIALFVGGLALDFVGMIRKKRSLLLAGWFNLVLAAATAVVGLITGYTALVLMHVPFKGIIRQHIITAIASSIIIWILVALRVHRHERMSVPIRIVYYILAAAGLLLISYAGHVGGMFVYGE